MIYSTDDAGSYPGQDLGGPQLLCLLVGPVKMGKFDASPAEKPGF